MTQLICKQRKESNVAAKTSKTAHKHSRKPTSTRRATTRSRTAHGRKTVRSRPAAKKAKKASSTKRWSQHVTQESDALDLKQGVFKLHDPKKIAASLKRSAEHSSRRKANPYRSALSMLTFYINRAGKTLPGTQRKRLERAKAELKHLFHREA